MIPFAKRAEERFKAKIIFPINPDDCWEWFGGRGESGHGRVYYQGKIIQAHHLSWILYKGPIPIGLWVLHKCDNPPCVNPDHLWLGTHRDNMDDAKAKKRMHNPGRSHRTVCSRGHTYTSETTKWYRGWRYCIPCTKINRRARTLRARTLAAGSGTK